MGIAITLAQYLAERGVKYDVVEHPFAVTASESAKTSHVSLNRLAKAVVLKGDEGFMLAVLPASSHIQFGRLRKQLGADVDMANEEQIETLFVDCERGAVVLRMGSRSLLTTAWQCEPEIYLEGGDHASLVHISGSTFQRLLADARHARFTETA
jgi:Ala-tRNA(Pro) deacylase